MSSSSSPVNQVRADAGTYEVGQLNGMKLNVYLPADALGAGSGSGAMILTLLVFALGIGLIAMDVWASLPAPPPSPPIKTPLPAADAASL